MKVQELFEANKQTPTSIDSKAFGKAVGNALAKLEAEFNSLRDFGFYIDLLTDLPALDFEMYAGDKIPMPAILRKACKDAGLDVKWDFHRTAGGNEHNYIFVIKNLVSFDEKQFEAGLKETRPKGNHK